MDRVLRIALLVWFIPTITSKRPTTKRRRVPVKRGKGCKRPNGWCNHHREIKFVDCDGDGVPDPYCAHNNFSGYIGSKTGCKDTWPEGICGATLVTKSDVIPKRRRKKRLHDSTNKNRACNRPNGWCNPRHKFMFVDCDGDGVPDPYCTSGKQSGYIGSNIGCKDTWPKRVCGASLAAKSGTISKQRTTKQRRGTMKKNKACDRPKGWCRPQHKFLFVDCDGDGVLDPLCVRGNRSGFIGSNIKCRDTWPTGVCGASLVENSKSKSKELGTWLNLKGRVATQTTTDFGGKASRAVDGDTHTKFNEGSCTHTSNTQKSWWEVKLVSENKINTVQVTNRQDNGDRLNPFQVMVDGKGCAKDKTCPPGKTVDVSCKAVGKVVKIMLQKPNFLSLCEVKIKTEGEPAVKPKPRGKGKGRTTSTTTTKTTTTTTTTRRRRRRRRRTTTTTTTATTTTTTPATATTTTSTTTNKMREKKKKQKKKKKKTKIAPAASPHYKGRWLNLTGRAAAQTSTENDGKASHAVDGNGDGFRCTETSLTAKSWWQVNLGETYQVYAVRVRNRKKHGDRLNPFKVEVDGKACATNQRCPPGGTIDIACVQHGSLVKIELQRPNRLSLCEVKVKASPLANPTSSPPLIDNGRWLNLQGIAATQVGTLYGGQSSRALDGSTNSRFSMASCTHTDKSQGAWWQVNLGSKYTVYSVQVSNRKSLWDRLNPFQIEVDSRVCARNQTCPSGRTVDVGCMASGSTVKIALQKSSFLTLCEVKVKVKVAGPSPAVPKMPVSKMPQQPHASDYYDYGHQAHPIVFSSPPSPHHVAPREDYD